MNNRSLSQNYVKKQIPSWNDDPFELGTAVFKELRPMSHKRNLSNYAEDLVSQYAKEDGNSYVLWLSDLPEDKQNELVRLYLEANDRETTECVYGDDFTINSEFTCALLNMLKNDCKDSREHFATVTRTNTLTYYKDTLNELLCAACDNFVYMQLNEQGYYTQQDRDSGDVLWGRF